jgi:hypothetical protein
MDSNSESSPVLTKEAQAGLSHKEVPQTKRGRGRPAKYAKEEREQKYKEAKEKWKENNKEHILQLNKEYYNDHQKKIIQYQKEYQDRSRYAMRILTDIYNDQESLSHLAPNIQYKLRNLIEEKQILRV